MQKTAGSIVEIRVSWNGGKIKATARCIDTENGVANVMMLLGHEGDPKIRLQTKVDTC